MGVQGLNHFMEKCCPDTCIKVNLRKMAEDHRAIYPYSTPTLVVDGMACVRQWYTCQAWVHGGQWKEYMYLLNQFVSAFSALGIRLVFYFDGTVEDRKRAEWVRRRLRSNRDIAKIFHFIKTHKQQPGKELFALPSGLPTFSRFALKSLGQEVKCSTREADFEIASYANSHAHDCMGILSQDSDFVIYDTVPYLSASKLCLKSMTTVLFSRERLCHVLELQKTELPVLACLLGNDFVPESCMRHVRDRAVNDHRSQYGQHEGEVFFALAQFMMKYHTDNGGYSDFFTLPLSMEEKELLENGRRSYVLPGQFIPFIGQEWCPPDKGCAMEKLVSASILQVIMAYILCNHLNII